MNDFACSDAVSVIFIIGYISKAVKLSCVRPCKVFASIEGRVSKKVIGKRLTIERKKLVFPACRRVRVVEEGSIEGVKVFDESERVFFLLGYISTCVIREGESFFESLIVFSYNS